MPGTARSHSADSFDLVSVGSDDHIVWPRSAAAAAHPAGRPWADDASEPDEVNTDDDFILLRATPRRVRLEDDQPAPGVETGDELAPALSALALGVQTPVSANPTPEAQPKPQVSSPRKTRRKRRGKASQAKKSAPPVSPPSAKAKGAAQVPAATAKKAKAGTKAKPASTKSALGQSKADNTAFATYEEAVNYITGSLSDASHKPKDKTTQLTFLQALIIELGLYYPLSEPSDAEQPRATHLPSPPSTPAPGRTPANAAGTAPPKQPLGPLTVLPRTLTSARAALKSRVFLNVSDYLAVRGDPASGPAPLQAIMHPSRSALARALCSGKSAVTDAAAKGSGSGGKRRKRLMPLKSVKGCGLDVLLVSCRFR